MRNRIPIYCGIIIVGILIGTYLFSASKHSIPLIDNVVNVEVSIQERSICGYTRIAGTYENAINSTGEIELILGFLNSLNGDYTVISSPIFVTEMDGCTLLRGPGTITLNLADTSSMIYTFLYPFCKIQGATLSIVTATDRQSEPLPLSMKMGPKECQNLERLLGMDLIYNLSDEQFLEIIKESNAALQRELNRPLGTRTDSRL